MSNLIISYTYNTFIFYLSQLIIKNRSCANKNGFLIIHMRSYITYISEEIHTILTKILYHLRGSYASGTPVLSLAVIFVLIFTYNKTGR